MYKLWLWMTGAGVIELIANWGGGFPKHRGNGSKTIASARARGHFKVLSWTGIQLRNFNK